MLKRALAALGAVAATSSLASASQIIPFTCGGVDWQFWGMQYANSATPGTTHDAPVWDDTLGKITGGGDKSGTDWGDYNGGVFDGLNDSVVGYIDLGSDWRNITIQQTWSESVTWRAGGGVGFGKVWFANDNTNVTPDSSTEVGNVLNWNTTAYDNAGGWHKDSDLGTSGMPAQGRYLMVQLGTLCTNSLSELAIVGAVPEPASLGLLACTVGLLMARRRRTV